MKNKKLTKKEILDHLGYFIHKAYFHPLCIKNWDNLWKVINAFKTECGHEWTEEQKESEKLSRIRAVKFLTHYNKIINEYNKEWMFLKHVKTGKKKPKKVKIA